jgi:hypothetical protein
MRHNAKPAGTPAGLQLDSRVHWMATATLTPLFRSWVSLAHNWRGRNQALRGRTIDADIERPQAGAVLSVARSPLHQSEVLKLTAAPGLPGTGAGASGTKSAPDSGAIIV